MFLEYFVVECWMTCFVCDTLVVHVCLSVLDNSPPNDSLTSGIEIGVTLLICVCVCFICPELKALVVISTGCWSKLFTNIRGGRQGAEPI